jgi:predicted RNase H-like HicB family nuclease
MPRDLAGGWNQARIGLEPMIELPYSLVIEATDEPEFFGFYSPELDGFTGVGHSLEDCLYQARWGMLEFVQLLNERNLPVPPRNLDPTVLVRNQQRSSAVEQTSSRAHA